MACGIIERSPGVKCHKPLSVRTIEQALLLPSAADVVESKSFPSLYLPELGTNMWNASVVIEHPEIEDILGEILEKVFYLQATFASSTSQLSSHTWKSFAKTDSSSKDQ